MALVIILKMNKLGCPIKIQVRIGRCALSKDVAPSRYCFSLAKGTCKTIKIQAALIFLHGSHR